MKIRYLDMVGDPVEVDREQFKTDYVKGKVNLNQNVTVNGTPVSVPRLLEIIEEAEDNATIKTARKAMLEEEQFQKTAPLWLKRNSGCLITYGIMFFSVCAPALLFIYDVCGGTGESEGIISPEGIIALLLSLLWLLFCLFHRYVCYVGGVKRYDDMADQYRMDKHGDILRVIEKRCKRGSNGDDKDGGKDHS
ncbi:MAG: hypothetical protein IJL92_00590 [Thermoguttaceae bacterium]|nr:hypothetical protein [Thermoguttaceae bacterium]